MNGVLSTNIVKHQGYKSKSKCWGSSTIASQGKIENELRQEAKNNGKLFFSMLKKNDIL
jgi:hypothetical protein